MKSNRVFTLAFASACSCSTNTGPICLYTVLFGDKLSNSCIQDISINNMKASRKRTSTHLLHDLVLGPLRIETLSSIDGGREIVLDLLIFRGGRLKTILKLLGRGGHRGRRRPARRRTRRASVGASSGPLLLFSPIYLSFSRLFVASFVLRRCYFLVMDSLSLFLRQELDKNSTDRGRH